MANFMDVVNRINYLDNMRDGAIKRKEATQKALETLFAEYLNCLSCGSANLVEGYANMIKKYNEVLIVLIDLEIETLEQCSNLLKELVVKRGSPEDYDRGLSEVAKKLLELVDKSLKIAGNYPT